MYKLKYFNIYFILAIHLIPFILYKFLLLRKHLIFIIFFTIIKATSITLGNHRLWTHKSYDTKKWIKIILIILCNGTLENSTKIWTINHRMHHRFENIDPELDPYSITKGFLWAHLTCNFYHKSENMKRWH